ncbi:uncharacterized protein LOC112514443 [Cynara cardunculus var. scolymus]|uniref:Uncharacterized protein n=1 Tax=Cynara cardunculus var. scolymus TaxID=59895 RepID=A0A103XY41_CYNCS|nr:uncharacterized protein LOC112514443 [Cynara cardunculus var. scolymus]KVH99080.1 hypothetical protein Ccrd_022675 [Cynara cardunculus var. scolymus]
MGIWDDLRSVAFKFINRSTSHKSSDSTTISRIESMPDPDRRETITRVLTGFSKFAVDSAVNESLKGGLQLYKIAKEGMKDQEATNLNNKPRHTLMMEEMQARMEKMEEDLHIIRLDDEDSILCAKDLDPRKEESTEPTEKSETDIKKVFIRSRL